MDKLIYEYYSLTLGVEPDDIDYDRTKATALYLKDNGYNDKKILELFKLINKERITGEDLPEELWETSLLEKNKFYYSDIFHIKSKPPSWNPITFKEETEPFFLEMKIKFTMNELLDYFYDKCRVPVGLRDEKKHAGALNHLIAKYDRFKKVPGIDYIIGMINRASEDIEKQYLLDVFQLEEYNGAIINAFNDIYEQASYEKVNQIIWRN